MRRTVLTALAGAADAAGVAICTTAVNQKMADSYMADLPGLADTGWAFPRGRKLHRQPAPTGPVNDL